MGLWFVRPHEVYAPRKRHPPTILPAESKGNIRCADFECVDSCEALTALMDRAAAAGKGLRVIGSGWSWNPIIEADGRSSNMVFTGPMSTRIAFDVAGLRASVAAGASICDFVFKAEEEGLEVEWPAKGFCFTPSESQTFGGFLATNVHHSHTPTAFDWVEAVEVAVFAGGVAAVVTASREVRPDLFASVFGSVGITGILVGLQLRLRRARRYDVRTDHGRLRPHSLFGSSSVAEVLLQVLEPDTMCQISTSEGEYCVRVVPEAADPAAPASMVLERDGDGKNDGVSSLLVPDYNSLLPCLLCPLCCSCGAATRRACSWFGLATPCCGQEGSYHGDQGHSLARGAVRWLSASLRNDTVQQGSSLSLYQAQSWVWGRMYPVKRGAVAMTGESVLHFDGGDLSFFVQRADYATFVALVAPLVEQAPPFCIGVRYVPRGGGLMAPNCDGDAICVEFGYIKSVLWFSRAHETWLQAMLDELEEAGLRLYRHPGKAYHPHRIFREVLSAGQRAELRRLRAEYDPHGVFDGGKLKFEALYSLRPPGEEVALPAPSFEAPSPPQQPKEGDTVPLTSGVRAMV